MDISKIVGIFVLIIFVIVVLLTTFLFTTEKQATFLVKTLSKRYDRIEAVSSFLASKYNGKEIYQHLVDICEGKEDLSEIEEYLELLRNNGIFVYLDFCNNNLTNYDLKSLNLTVYSVKSRAYRFTIIGNKSYIGAIYIAFVEK